MFGSNAHYGHRTILNRYGGVPEGTPIPGLVEHGWNYDLGATLEDILLPAPQPFFVWSEPNLRACEKAGIGDRVVALGAPFLYLPPLEEKMVPAPESLLVMPCHGWEKAKLAHDFEQYARDIDAIAKEFSSVTVCLYWFEYQEAHYRKIFESRGYNIVTSGQRDKNPMFLYDLRKMLSRYEYVSSNRVQTATFYALHLRRKVFIHGPPVGVEQRLDRSGALYDAWQNLHYPMLIWKNFQDDTYPDLAARELGLPFVRTPDALCELFFWQPRQREKLDEFVAAHRRRLQAKVQKARLEPWKKALATLPVFRRYFSD